MRPLVLALPLAASVSAVPLEARQTLQLPAGLNLPPQLTQMLQGLSQAAQPILQQLAPMITRLIPQQKVASSQDFTPTIPREGVKAVRLKYGPFEIKAANSTQNIGNGPSMDPHGTGYNFLLPDIPKDITILKTNSSMVYEDGTPADLSTGMYVHHVLVLDTAKMNPKDLQMVSCPSGKQGMGLPLSEFMAVHESADYAPYYFTSMDGKYNSGYYISKDDPIIYMIDVVNYANETKKVHMVHDMEYLPGKIPGFRDAAIKLVSYSQCGDSPLAVNKPQGSKFNLTSEPMTLLESGRILAMNAHLHDGAINMKAKLNGKEICNSEAIYGGSGSTLGGAGGMGDMHSMDGGHGGDESSAWQTISKATQCFDIDVKKNDTLSLEAYYDMTARPARPHAMGMGEGEQMAIMGFFFAPDVSE